MRLGARGALRPRGAGETGADRRHALAAARRAPARRLATEVASAAARCEVGERRRAARRGPPAEPVPAAARLGMDGLTRRRGGVIERLLHDERRAGRWSAPPRPSRECVVFGARASSTPRAEHGIARMRFALGVDDDLSEFHRRFARDPLIGRSLRRRPWLRVGRRPEPFEALVWAVCEQLIEYERAAAIQRRLVARLGRRWPSGHGAGQRAARRADGAGAGRHRAGAAGVLRSRRGRAPRARSGRPRGRARPRRPARLRARARLAAAARDPRDRRLDGRDAGAVRPGPLRPAAGRRPGAAEARRAVAQRRRSAGARRANGRCASCSRPTASGRGWRRCTPAGSSAAASTIRVSPRTFP